MRNGTAVADEPADQEACGLGCGNGHHEAGGREMIGLVKSFSCLNGFHELADIVERIIIDPEQVVVGQGWAEQ